MKKILSSFAIALVLAVSSFTSGHGLAAPEEEKILYKAEMKSEKELRKDALSGKKDYDFKNLKVQLTDEDGNIVKDLSESTHYTVQKLKETKVGEQVLSDYVVYALADYDARDQDSNPGINFTQTVWMWTSILKENNIDVWGKATRYEAKWELNDGNGLTIKGGEFNASANGRSKSTGKTIMSTDPTPYYPPSWGRTYVKLPTWDYIRIDDQYGAFGARVATAYTARSSSSTLYSTVVVGSGSLPFEPWVPKQP
ncbi:hypothetical protein [Brevibacillus centrosporus]|jgi:hypothetical protein|uniref:hypothetical protein n=1 Tax=Brevibacillus centrosporus TaxID=54910 RepID=UPI003985B09A